MFKTDSKIADLLLIILFGLFIFFILAILLFPNLTFFTRHKEKSSIAVLIDATESMNLPYDENTTRIHAAKNKLLKLKEDVLDEYIENGGSVEYFKFGEKLNNLTDLQNLHCEKSLFTNLYSVLRETIRGKLQSRLKGIILLSDGGQTEQDILDESILPVYVLPALKYEKVRDIFIEDVDYPDVVFTAKEDTLLVYIGNKEFDNEEVTITLYRNNEKLNQKKIRLITQNERVEFRLFEDKQGEVKYRIEIAKKKAELLFLNNYFEWSTSVLKDKIRVMCISGRPRWEYKFLRTLLKQDPKVELVSFVILREPEQNLPFAENELSLIPFPIREILYKNLDNFDLLVLDNFDYSRFSMFFPAYYLDQIERFVSNSGGLLILGGSKSFNRNYKNTAIDRISPLIVSINDETYKEEKFKITIPDKAYNHPILGGVSPSEWNAYPELIDYNLTEDAKPEAIVLGCHPVVRTRDNKPLPIIAVMEYGKGRVMAVASGSTYRWNFISTGEGKANTHYYRFFHKAIRWLIKNPELQPIRLNLAFNRIKENETQKIDIYTLDEYYEPLENVKVKVIIKDSKNKEYYPSLKDKPFKGLYSYSFIPSSPGVYEVTALISTENKPTQTLQKTFTVEILSKELITGTGNMLLLEKIAKISKGMIIKNEGEFALLKERLKKDIAMSFVDVENVIRWWNSKGVLMIGSGIVLLHWVLRKRWSGR
ncbi:MAG: glutamine amidotransferase [Candidatus Hydrogenedentota bacterium]